MPPNTGYGPADADYSGQIDPFAAFDNRIRYNDMIRRQMVTQYQQSVARPATMTLAQQRYIASDPRFQYGVAGGQDQRTYQRQAAMSRSAYGSAVLTTGMDIAGWQLAAGGVAAAGMKGLAATMGIPLAVSMAGMHFVNKGVQNSLERQRYMHSTAADIEQYRDQLGFNEPLSYKQATMLGRNISGAMYGRAGKGSFFSIEDMSRIHKIGLSNRMLSAGGGGPGMSGTLRQYERNVAELTDTTEEVVKLLQTTIEGGMSVIKELQQSGFGTMGQVRQQVRQAKAFGGITGLGAQNMMQIGAAGARAVQGTPWDATAGASMYQSGAASASFMRGLGASQAYAVRRAGGVAAAGGALANFQMNVLSSGMGTKLAAYAMNADGTVDNARMGKLLSGSVSAYDMVQGANQRGYDMGPSGRVLFEFNKADMFNNMNDVGRAQAVNRLFQAWSSNRPGSSAAQAAVFAGQFAGNQRERRLFQQYLLSPKGFDEQWGAGQAVRAGMMDIDVRRTRYRGPVMEAIRGMNIGGGFDRLGSDIVYAGGGMMAGVGRAWRGMGRAVGRATEDFLGDIGIADQYGMFNRAQYGDAATAMRAAYGVGMTAPERGLRALRNRGPLTTNVKAVNLGIGAADIVNRLDRDDLQYLYQQTANALWSGTANTLMEDDNIMRTLGKAGVTQKKAAELFRSSPIGTANAIISTVNQKLQSVSKEKDDAMTEWEKADKNWKAPQRQMMHDRLEKMRQFVSAMPQITTGRAAGVTVADVARSITKATGEDVTGAAFALPLRRALAEQDAINTDIGPPSRAKLQDIEAREKKVEAGIEQFFGAGRAEQEFIGPGPTGTSGIVTRSSVWNNRAQARILSKYTRMRGKGEVISMRTPEERQYAWEIGKQLAAERGAEFIDLKGKYARSLTGRKTDGAEWFGTDEYMNRRKHVEKLLTDVDASKAYEIRAAKGDRFNDYLTRKLGKDVDSREKSIIKGIMTYQTTDKQIEELVGAGGTMTDLIAEGMMISEKQVMELAKTPEMLRRKMAGTFASKSHQEKSPLEKAREDLDRYRVKVEVAKGLKKPEEREKALTDAMEAEGQAQLRYDRLKQEYMYDESGRGKTSYANVQPPVTNYWNNRWTL